MPDRAPIRFVGLRCYLDREKLSNALGDSPASDELLAALLDPAGAGPLPTSAGSVRGASAFHRIRLRLRLARRPKALPEPGSDPSPRRLWQLVRTTVSAFQPALNDALLGELLASLQRRAARAGGLRLERRLGRQAHALRSGRRTDLASLGIVDPLADAWSESPGVEEHVGPRLGELPEVDPRRRAHPLRGEFRESLRRALNPIRAAYLRFASDARRRGLLEEVGDAFFLPFDLAEDLTTESAPAWLAQAVAANRAEYQRLLEIGSPPEVIEQRSVDSAPADRGDWVLAPLWPLD